MGLYNRGSVQCCLCHRRLVWSSKRPHKGLLPERGAEGAHGNSVCPKQAVQWERRIQLGRSQERPPRSQALPQWWHPILPGYFVIRLLHLPSFNHQRLRSYHSANPVSHHSGLYIRWHLLPNPRIRLRPPHPPQPFPPLLQCLRHHRLHLTPHCVLQFCKVFCYILVRHRRLQRPGSQPHLAQRQHRATLSSCDRHRHAANDG